MFGEASEDFNMPLIYAFVARGTTVLAEHTGHSGNFATVAAEVRRGVDLVLFSYVLVETAAAARRGGCTVMSGVSGPETLPWR